MAVMVDDRSATGATAVLCLMEGPEFQLPEGANGDAEGGAGDLGAGAAAGAGRAAGAA